MNMRPEDQLLLGCARTKSSKDNQDTIRKLASNGLDWDYLLQMSKIHGLTPLLYYRLPGEESEELVKRFFTKFDPKLQTIRPSELTKKRCGFFCFEL